MGEESSETTTIPKERFDRVYSERNRLRDELRAAQQAVEASAAQQQQIGELTTQVETLRTDHAAAQVRWEEDRGLMRAGLLDDDAAAVARVLHQRLPEADRPGLAEWVERLAADPAAAPRALAPYLQQPEQPAPAVVPPVEPPGLGGTNGHQRPSAPQAVNAPLGGAEIAQIRQKCQETGDWSTWRAIRDRAYGG